MICPSCGSTRVFPSRLRNVIETLRHRLTDKQPYRCHQCGWRRWREIEIAPPQPDVRPDDLRIARGTSPVASGDLDPLDPGNGR
jgi:transposase-like protein